MRPGRTDIVTKKDRSGNTTYWASQEFILEALNITEVYLKNRMRPAYLESVSPSKRNKDILPDTGNAWRFARINNRFYYDLERIPNQAPTYYRSRLPENPETLLQMAQQTDLKGYYNDVKTTLEAAINAHTADYAHCYRGYTRDKVQALSRACAALQGIIEGTDAHSIRYYEAASAALVVLGVDYLPTNWRRLKQKADLVRSGAAAIADVVNLPRLGNQNARKLNDPEVEAWVIQMRGMPANYTNAYIQRKVRWMCDITGKRVPSESWIAQLLAQPETKFITSAGRYGERGRKGSIYRLYTPVANALYAGDAWQVDGSRVNFIPWKNPDTGREEFLYMIAVRDVHSGAVLGGYFGLVEDRWAYVDALLRAVRTAQYLPYELIIDRFPGHNTPEWQMLQMRLESMGVKVSYKHKATGKAQVERWFETLQSVFFQESAYYYGEGIQSTRQAAHRSAEYIKSIRRAATDSGWNFDAACREAERCIRAYNNTPLAEYSRRHKTIESSPMVLHSGSEKPHVKSPVPADLTALTFGHSKTLGIRNGVIETEINRTRYIYRLAEDVIMQHKQVTIAYLPDQLDVVYLFAGTNPADLQPIGEAKRLEAVQMYGPSADYHALGRDQQRRQNLETARKNRLAERKGAGDVTLYLNGNAPKSDAEEAENKFLEGFLNAGSPGNQPRILDIENQPEPTSSETEDEGGVIDIRELVLRQM